MDFPASRRVAGAKYGKTRKVLGYNFFNVEAKQPSVVPATIKLPISPSSPGTVTLDNDEPIVPPESPSRSPVVRPAHVTTHLRSSVSHSNDSRSGSPVKQSPGTADNSMFDLNSSDEEHDGKAQPPTKRRKFAQPLKQKHAATEPQTQTVATATKTKRQALAKKEENMRTQHSRVEAEAKPRPVVLQKQRKTKPTTSTDSDLPPANELQPTKVASKTKLKRVTYGRKQTTTSRSGQVSHLEDINIAKSNTVPQLAQSPTVDSKTTSIAGHTPKKLQHTLDSDTSGGSPSQLGLRDLRLTPEKNPGSRAPSAPASPATPVSPPHRGRARRIDLLDAPDDESQTSTRDVSVEPVTNSLPAKQKPQDVRERQQIQSNRPKLSRSGSSQTRQTYGKGRNTYGRERSHLANMIDDIDAFSNDSGQEASQQLLSQLTSQSGPSQLQMELDQEGSSSDDAMLGVKLKSIHELRQAGTNNRFERDLETILEDVDPLQKTRSKSLRLQGLMKLFRKMEDTDFTNFASDRALDRLAAWSRSVKDKLSKLLFDMTLWRITHAKNISPTKLRTIVQAVTSSTALITNLHTMAQIARDRKENLSKQLLRDLAEFEEMVLTDNLLPEYDGAKIVPAAVTLGVLHDSLRKLAEAGAANMSVGGEACKSIVVMLEKASHITGDGAIQHKLVTKLALSLLKLFAGPLSSDLGLPDSEYCLLGNTLASIVDHSLNVDEELVQAVYYFAISLCNDRPPICRQFVLSNLPSSAMRIIESRFSTLVSTAEAGNDLDTVMLDSIILSLACLLNITEHEDQIRIRFADGSTLTTRPKHLQSLIQTYIEAAPKLEGATTAEQSQMLVSFGYLSLLICNLCLNDSLWTKTSRLLGDCSMSDVVASAKELLIHLQTLDMAQLEGDMSAFIEEGGTPLDGITQRFGQIIAAVRVE